MLTSMTRRLSARVGLARIGPQRLEATLGRIEGANQNAKVDSDMASTDPRILEIALKRPTKLYKFTGLDGPRMKWTRNLIVDSALFFARPRAFNDPLDCRIPPLFEADAGVIEHFFRDKWARRGQAPRSQEEIDGLVAKTRTKEGREQLTRAYYDQLDTYGIACFASRPDNFLMWSYYAASHTGVAVRFDTGDEILKLIPPPYFLLKVDYATDFPKVSAYEPDRLGSVQKTLSTKAKVWQHEEEWRLIAVGRSGIIQMPKTMIDGVVLGLRTSPEEEGEVRRWVAEAGREIELMRVQHRANSFALEVVPA
jgi:Protein of unknown function (DUF2971)